MEIVSWNVNGLKACIRKGMLDFVKKQDADIYCFQEIKLSKKDTVPHLEGYETYLYTAERNGYSGLLVYTKRRPLAVVKGIGDEEIDKEGRVMVLEFKGFFLVAVYFPHSRRELKRLTFKLGFNEKFEKFCRELAKKKPLLLAGDFNVAHTELDLANPKQNVKNAGFTPQERAWFDSFLKQGHIDTFREFVKDGGHYTWWTWRNNARARNIGWRIDYFLISEKLRGKLKGSKILSKVLGSDHCPILLETDL
jgi:exodeoxyribonuclease-3